jgi:hypothetical protein
MVIVRFLNGLRLLVVLAGMVVGCGVASANDIYIAQNAAGAGNGADCADAYAVSFFNTSANWGTSAGQIGPGTTVYLCGTISTELTVNGSGSSGSPITISFQSTAQISLPACDNTNGCLNVSGVSWIVVDGGTPCGPGTTCATSLSGTGVIRETANGSGLANQQDSIAINAQGGCSNCEFRNLIVGPVYQHTSSSDTHNFGADSALYMKGCNGCTTKVHDLTIHDTTSAVTYVPASSGDAGLQVYNVYAYNYNGGVNIAGSGSSNILSGATIHDSTWGSTANWDAAGCPYHHDGIHVWGSGGGQILGVNYFNNVVTGNYGACATGAAFFEGYTGNENLYNNLFLITYAQDNAGIVNLNGFNIGFYNNVILGNLQSGDICFEVGYSAEGSPFYTPSISFENNAVENCHGLAVQNNNPTLIAWDHNGYGELPSGSTLVYNGTWYYTLASWQGACACDLHSVTPLTGGIAGSLNLNAVGVPASGSPVISAGVNLTSLGITTLNRDTSAGGTVTPNTRSTTAAWDIGAYTYSSGVPVPPTSLSSVLH